MGKNLVTKTFSPINTGWTAPAGVTKINVWVYTNIYSQLGAAGTSNIALSPTGAPYGTGNSLTNGVCLGASVSSPILIVGGHKFRQLAPAGEASMLAVNLGGDMYGWGNNQAGQLGNGGVTSSSSPVLVSGGLKWRDCSLAGGGISLASAYGVASTYRGYAWGSNEHGQLGLGDVTARSSPVIIPSFSWLQISGGNSCAVGIRSTGAAYAWGRNGSGQLGVGDVTSRSSPVLVLGGLTWSRVCGGVDFITGNGSNYGITTDGLLYAWGDNTSGQLGDGTVVPKSSPVLISGSRRWRYIAAANRSAFAIERDTGNLYSWGINTNGNLGLGDVTPRSTPTLVLGNLLWAQVATCDLAVVASTLDGDIYAWGNNPDGGLGQGNVTPKSSPVIVLGSLSWRAATEALCAQQVMTVTPGTTYAFNFTTNVVYLVSVGGGARTLLYQNPYGSNNMDFKAVIQYEA